MKYIKVLFLMSVLNIIFMFFCTAENKDEELKSILGNYIIGNNAYYEILFPKSGYIGNDESIPADILKPLSAEDYLKIYFRITVKNIKFNINTEYYKNASRVIFEIQPIKNATGWINDSFPWFCVDFYFDENKLKTFSGTISSEKDIDSTPSEEGWGCVFTTIIPWQRENALITPPLIPETYKAIQRDVLYLEFYPLLQQTVFYYNVLNKIYETKAPPLDKYVNQNIQMLESKFKHPQESSKKTQSPNLYLRYTEIQWWRPNDFLWERMVRYSNRGYLLIQGRKLNEYPPSEKKHEIDEERNNYIRQHSAGLKPRR